MAARERYTGSGVTMDAINRDDLLGTLPEYYQEMLSGDDGDAALAFVRVIESAVSSMNAPVQYSLKPVERFVQTGQSGFESYFSFAHWTKENAPLITASQRQALNDLFAQSISNWQGAQLLLETLFPNKKVVLTEGRHVKRYLPSQQMTALKGDNSLGHNSVLGHKLEDRMNRCRFTVSVLSNEDLDHYGQDAFVSFVGSVLKAYVKQPLEIELVYVLSAQTQKSVALGVANQAVLGAKTWLSAAVGQEKELTYKL